jgi:LPS sulfotransferase NodH
VSLWRAIQTQSWRDDSADGPDRDPTPRYSFAALQHLVARLNDHNARWRELLAGAPALEITYEELTADLPGVIRRTLDHVGVADPVDVPQPAMRRQADELSESWVAAYARDQEPLTTSR